MTEKEDYHAQSARYERITLALIISICAGFLVWFPFIGGFAFLLFPVIAGSLFGASFKNYSQSVSKPAVFSALAVCLGSFFGHIPGVLGYLRNSSESIFIIERTLTGAIMITGFNLVFAFIIGLLGGYVAFKYKQKQILTSTEVPPLNAI